MSASALAPFAAATLAGLALTGLFAGLETGLYTINRVRLAVRSARGESAARRLRRELARANRTLIVLLLGTNASSYLASYGLAELLHGAHFSDWQVIGLEVLVLTPMLFVFAETLPKDLFRTHTDRWTYWFSPVIVLARWIFTCTLLLPIVHLITSAASRLLHGDDRGAITAQQRMSQLIKEGVGAGVLSVSQTTLADRAVAMRDRRVADVMVPWSKVATVPADADRAAREVVMQRERHRRLPAVDASGRVAGILSWVEAMLRRDDATRDLLEPPAQLAPDLHLLEALSSMRHGRVAMAVVVQPGTDHPLGLVTLKDLVEPLTGKLEEW